jgi:hypothetical protein
MTAELLFGKEKKLFVIDFSKLCQPVKGEGNDQITSMSVFSFK